MRRPERVEKAEFVRVMLQLAKLDREKYHELRLLGWRAVIPYESEQPN